ncbi:MAG: hypothetical protein SGARI_000275 [Bacillariaceae sp.]
MSSAALAAEDSTLFWPFRILSWILGLFFKKGWDWDNMSKAFEATDKLIDELSQPNGDYPSVSISAKDIAWGEPQKKSGVTLRAGSFPSPLAHLLPPESKDCQFLLVTPTSSSSSTYIVMLPATGEMGKRERLALAKTFARDQGYASIIVTAPFYARRKPSGQKRFFLDHVADALVSSQAIVQETTSVVRYIMRSNDDNQIIPASPSNKVVVTGFSWGSAMSSMTCATSLLAGVDGKRLACVAYVGCSSPEVFADGVIENGVDWNAVLKDKAKMSSFQGVDVSSLETPQQVQAAMLKILSQVQLSSSVDALVKKDPTNRLAAVKTYSMYDDGFLPRKYSSSYVDQMKRLTKMSNFQARWMPGGHILGAMLRPVLHKKAIVDAVHKMDKDS